MLSDVILCLLVSWNSEVLRPQLSTITCQFNWHHSVSSYYSSWISCVSLCYKKSTCHAEWMLYICQSYCIKTSSQSHECNPVLPATEDCVTYPASNQHSAPSSTFVTVEYTGAFTHSEEHSGESHVGEHEPNVEESFHSSRILRLECINM